MKEDEENSPEPTVKEDEENYPEPTLEQRVELLEASLEALGLTPKLNKYPFELIRKRSADAIVLAGMSFINSLTAVLLQSKNPQEAEIWKDWCSKRIKETSLDKETIDEIEKRLEDNYKWILKRFETNEQYPKTSKWN